MDDRDAQPEDEGAELVTPAVRAGQIAAGLARLAELARDPCTVNALPTFAGVLDTMRADADELAAVLAESEAEDEDAGEEIPEARNAEPTGGLPTQERATPLTFEALNLAVELLTRDAQTRVWPAQEAAELPGLVAEAVATVRAATKALHAFFKAQAGAVKLRGRVAMGERGQPAREPAELQFAFAAVDGARALVEAFGDMKEQLAGEPLARVVSALSNVQEGTGDPLFTPSRRHGNKRHIDAATLIGHAAAAMDAWQCAGLRRSDAAKRVASLFGGVRRHGGSTLAGVEAGTVAWWRDQAKTGRLTPKKAQGRWESYRERRDERRAAHPEARDDHEWHERHAHAIGGRIEAILANQGPGFTLIGKGREADRPRGHQRRTPSEIRASRRIRSNG